VVASTYFWCWPWKRTGNANLTPALRSRSCTLSLSHISTLGAAYAYVRYSSICWMVILTIIPLHSHSAMRLVSFVIALYQLFLITEAALLKRSQDECVQPHNSKATWDPVDKYTIELFQAEATSRPGPTLCLFYTRGLSETARRYAKSRPNGESPMTTIWVLAHSSPIPSVC
jgi:hypothetical protein